MSSNPAIIRNTVDFPHPDGPTITMNSPSAMFNDTPVTASNPFAYTFVMSSSTTSAIRKPPFG